jgi:hypothetical protein
LLLAGDSLFLAGTVLGQYKLEPLVSEYYGGRAGTNYYSVAVVPASFCAAATPTLANLKVRQVLTGS